MRKRSWMLSGIGFLGRRPLVPVGAGGDGLGGDPCGLRPAIDRDEGDHKGPYPTSQPLPPLRGRRRFPKTLYLKGSWVWGRSMVFDKAHKAQELFCFFYV